MATAALASFVEQSVLLLTQDGRVIVGILQGFDTAGSVILSACVERIFSAEAPVEEVPLGLYILRGDAISLVGKLDAELEKTQDLQSLRVDPIPHVRHT